MCSEINKYKFNKFLVSKECPYYQKTDNKITFELYLYNKI